MKPTPFTLWSAVCAFYCLLTPEAATVESRSISPKCFAVLRSGDVGKLREALDHGSSANARDARGNTPLMHAAVYGDLSCMRLLLDRGAEANATNAEIGRASCRERV